VPEQIHRADTGRSFEGIAIHAAQGVHEYAASLVGAGLPTGARLLDAGAGSGALSARLARLGYDVVAADLDASSFGGGVPIVEWDVAATSLPSGIDPGTFDGVCAIETLEHVADPSRALRNLFALLRPGGLLVVSTPNVTHPRSRIKFLLRGAPAYFGRQEFWMSGHRTILPDWLLGLLATNPFPGKPPAYVRASYYGYRFTTPDERRTSGQWWKREPIGLYYPPVRLTDR